MSNLDRNLSKLSMKQDVKNKMLSTFEIYTWNDFVTYLGCVAQAAVVVLPIAAVLWFAGKNIVKLLVFGLDIAYGCMVELKHNNKRKKGK